MPGSPFAGLWLPAIATVRIHPQDLAAEGIHELGTIGANRLRRADDAVGLTLRAVGAGVARLLRVEAIPGRLTG